MLTVVRVTRRPKVLVTAKSPLQKIAGRSFSSLTPQPVGRLRGPPGLFRTPVECGYKGVGPVRFDERASRASPLVAHAAALWVSMSDFRRWRPGSYLVLEVSPTVQVMNSTCQLGSALGIL